MANKICHFEVIGKDKAALETFYSSIFEWKLQPVMDEYSLVFPGVKPDGGIGTSPNVDHYATFYVEVADVAAHLEKIESLGGKKLMGPMQVPNGPIIGMFNDPAGNMIGLVQEGSGPQMQG